MESHHQSYLRPPQLRNSTEQLRPPRLRISHLRSSSLFIAATKPVPTIGGVKKPHRYCPGTTNMKFQSHVVPILYM
ncbi:hypothetical protein TSUD_391560 [Trifolium subterraneum]|uniref:Uncharacterized protein n=1 Tax=Trifolium subterraneum TaxID=3900 RepID=A0A2Z6P483_TRISU|nr:hypothetical protein TSUD_391560 [Trifolium subterraneum]